MSHRVSPGRTIYTAAGRISPGAEPSAARPAADEDQRQHGCQNEADERDRDDAATPVARAAPSDESARKRRDRPRWDARRGEAPAGATMGGRGRV